MFKRYYTCFGDGGGARYKRFFSLRKAIDYAVEHYKDASPWIYVDNVLSTEINKWSRLYLKTPKDKHYNIWINKNL